jgi:hypothetical protein|tara:strand:- start:345 stop:587 length:243 start_codon:yes stop_codon:yes gene_type:complete
MRINKYLIFLLSLTLYSCAYEKIVKNSMYDLDEFDACYLDHKSSLDDNKQKYLDMLIKLRNYNCSRYYELFVRGTIIQGY